MSNLTTTLRPLRSSEIAYVAGGDSDIIVIGRYQSDPGGFGGGGGIGGGNEGTGLSPFPYIPSEGGAWNPSPYADVCFSIEETEDATDFAASVIQGMISNQSDSNSREYGAIIYITGDGHVRIGDLVRGETVAEAIAAGRDAPRTVIPVPDTNGGIVLGWVHNHPDIGYDASGDFLNKMPSDNDWSAFLSASQRPDFSTSAILSQYIVGPDGFLREYNLRDGKPSAPNGENIYNT